ncbi:hypothetical protein [Paracraurococcus lichenis]|uniref:Uncharacterized protein n=1 Tax=Paracraurococcus lichenis TaxID=3064888 RepID=A0ABT9E0T3_9PROT|nr:hypothetical protein [Paracraurococcus sp. LOR1-02]MDO9709776.1 hypothetical protein [Paracraurococcus sp. LOR1-02]
MNRRLLLALPAGLAASAALRAMAAPARPAPDLDIPICRGGLRRVAEVPQRDASTPEAADADYLEKVGLLEGHLIVGRRLLEAGQARLAVPHFGHPIRELYTWLEPRLAARRAPQFERELEVMEGWAEGGNTGTNGRFGDAWTSLAPKLAAAKRAVAPERLASPRFMLSHVAMMVYDVASDYGESIERGRIVNVVEYHDSMGFLAYAAQTAAEQRAAGRAATEWAEAADILEELRKLAYPELLPPGRLPTSVSSVRSRSDRIQDIAARVVA